MSVGYDGTWYEWERVQDAKHGAGWREPDIGQERRSIWWDRVENNKTPKQAKEFCESLGLDLPENEDFERLRSFMGSEPGTHTGFKSQVLPDLKGRWFWSSSVHPTGPDYAYYFDGYYGDIGYGNCSNYNFSVRCVAR